MSFLKLPLGFIFWFLTYTLYGQSNYFTKVSFNANAYSHYNKSNEKVTKVYFYVATPAKHALSIDFKNESSINNIKVTVDDKKNPINIPIQISNGMLHKDIGIYNFGDTGYHYLTIKESKKEKNAELQYESLIIKSNVENAILYNQSNYKGAASTHLRYIIPGDSAIQWFYTEVKVPNEAKNSINAYYETNGFHSGYGGIQINSKQERRFIFSIWSLFKTDDPKKIPAFFIVHLNKKGQDVFTSDFGDEGSGGHSHLVFPWKTNNTYRFLSGITSLKGDSATYIGYYAGPEDGYQWHLLSQWTQHATDTKIGLTHLYAFVENFDDNGDDYFKAYYSNQWAITFNGTWIELNQARFTTTANKLTHQRYDYGAGVEEGQFYMFTGGFKKRKNIQAGDIITKPLTGKHIDIDFKWLGVK